MDAVGSFRRHQNPDSVCKLERFPDQQREVIIVTDRLRSECRLHSSLVIADVPLLTELGVRQDTSDVFGGRFV